MKKYDIVAVVGEYTNNEGQVKKKYEAVGAVIENANGPFITIKRSFNLASIGEGENAFLSLFEPKGQMKAPSKSRQTNNHIDDEGIPF